MLFKIKNLFYQIFVISIIVIKMNGNINQIVRIEDCRNLNANSTHYY